MRVLTQRATAKAEQGLDFGREAYLAHVFCSDKAMQIGSNDPMEVPVQMAGQTQFTKPDPKTLVGSETVKVSAGSFKTK